MNKENIKNTLYFIGKSLGFLGILFVLYTLWKEYTLDSFTHQFILLFPMFPFLILVNILSIVIGIYAWHRMLLHYATKPFPFMASYYYFTKTEVAKYLPGNIFHFLGRQVLSGKIGITQIQMAKTSMLFSFLLLTGTLLVTTLFSLFTEETPLYILTLLSLFSIISLIVLIYLYPTFPVVKKFSINIYLALSVALQGIMLGTIILYQSDIISTNLFFQCIAIYTISWLLGFITPGASGGIGIREGTFILIANHLQIHINNDVIIFSVLLVRLINIGVDVVMYSSTLLLKKKMKELKL